MLGPRLHADDGFSLVELLVAILIAGILAAVALPAFLNQRAKAQDAHATTSAVTAAAAMRVWETQREGSFAGAAPSDLAKIEPALGRTKGLAVTSDERTFTVTVESLAGGTYSIERHADGDVVRGCSLPGKGACAATADAHGNRW